MKKEVRKAVTPLYQYFCDANGEQITADFIYDSFNGGAICDIIGCTIQFNCNYRGIADGINELNEVHLSEKVTREFLAWLEEKYPNAPLISKLKEHSII